MIFSTNELHPAIAGQLGELGQLRIASAPERDAIMAESVGAEFIVVRAAIPVELVERETSLRALVRHGAGLDMIPVEDCTAAGVLVANVPGVNAVTVAEHVIWSTLAILRNFMAVDRDLRSRSWEDGRRHANVGRELTGKTMGIVGMGNMGRALLRIANGGFAMNVLAHSRTPGKIPAPARTVTLPELLQQSDVVVLCCPLTDETRGMIDAAALAAMKPGAVLVNVARGPIVVEDDLVAALKNDHLAGAVLDVFADQPLDRGSVLFDQPNVILTPHMAGITQESMLRMGQGVVDEISRIIGGELPINFVNPDSLQAYRARFG